ncbi:heme o synthase [Halorientalis halophila]|uniref:heme o synthase n=1 Tax=Halorientalis halophila TaxID=3108499 RepID=UPI003008F296
MTAPAALLSLIKPRIAGLLCLTGVTASVAAGGLPLLDLLAFAVAGVGMAGGAAALNCYYDRDIDPKMDRTADRPLATGAVAPRAALSFAAALLLGATLLALWRLPPVAVAYMWLGVLSYVGLYTVLLKRRHWLGVVLGGSAGSFPVLAGWTAVRPLALPAVVMAALVFVWTPAHAWALAVVYREDFAAAEIPTLPVVAAPSRVRRGVWVSALATVGTAGLLVPFAGPVYAGAVLPAAALFGLAYRPFARRGGDARAVRAFFSSNVFLAAVFLGWAVSGITDAPVVAVAVALGTVGLFVGIWSRRPALDGVRAAPGPDWAGLATRARDRLTVELGGL